MSHHKINYLRLHRKRSPLSQLDIAYLVDTHFSNISKWEKGQRMPNIEILLTYHLLFNTSIEQFFEPQLNTIKPTLLSQIKRFIGEKKRENVPKHKPSISFLNQTLTRLTN